MHEILEPTIGKCLKNSADIGKIPGPRHRRHGCGERLSIDHPHLLAKPRCCKCSFEIRCLFVGDNAQRRDEAMGRHAVALSPVAFDNLPVLADFALVGVADDSELHRLYAYTEQVGVGRSITNIPDIGNRVCVPT